MEQQKAQLRRHLLKKRQALLPEDWHNGSNRLCSHLRSSALYAQARTILAYFSIRQEPDLSPLFADSQRRWGFPGCVGKSLIWHSWKPGEPLKAGMYGIWEPESTVAPIEASEVDLILVPAVACDWQGYRLGYGGGFYDRLLSLREWASKLTVGIVFDFAYLSELPVDPWDKPLHAICTETELTVIATSNE